MDKEKQQENQIEYLTNKIEEDNKRIEEKAREFINWILDEYNEHPKKD